MRLSAFITGHKESILQAWENFARTIDTPGSPMGKAGLRDHAAHMLDTIVEDLDTYQTASEQSQKSRGLGQRESGESYAETHAAERLSVGYSIDELISEYRALRASVLRLWATHPDATQVTDMDDMTRFNEAIDQALAESVTRFAKLTQAAIQTERNRLEAILQAAPVGIGIADKDGKMVLLNYENRRIWGEHPDTQSMDDLGGWRAWWADGSARHGQPLTQQEWALARALKGNESPRDVVEIEPFGSPGERRTILLHAEPIRDAINNVVGSVMAQMDITAQVRMEEALRESEAKFRTIANAMPQVVWSTRPDGFHDYYNQKWYDFTGVPEGSTDGEGWSELFHPEDQPRAWALWRNSLATGELYEVHYRLRHHTGEYRWTLGRALPVRSENGEITRWMGTCTDIHDHKQGEEMLKEESQRKDEFLAMLAHELRNPLAPISTAAKILRAPGVDDKLVRQASDIISRQVKHMTNLVDDLLEVSRITRGLVELAHDVLDLKLIITNAIEQARPLIEVRHHELIIRIAAEPCFVKGDRTRLVQVVANLLNNAAKYTPQGGNIELVLEVLPGVAEIRVTDNGSGISPSLMPYVFDLFTQGERTPDRAQGGLGLGLSLVKNITALHGGKVAANSAGAGQGSTFTLNLPLIDRSASQLAELAASDGALRTLPPLSLMIVDDNLDAAQTLAALMQMDGHKVTVMEGAKAVLEHSANDQVDAFILDIGLPGMNGFELARRLRADPSTAGATLIALTGYGQAHDRVLTKAAGFDHHLVKPLDTDELERALKTVNLAERRG